MNARSLLVAVIAGAATLSAATGASGSTTTSPHRTASPHGTTSGRAAVSVRGFRVAAGLHVPGGRLPRVISPGAQSVSNSPNWAGYVAAGQPNVALRFVSGDWTMPSLNASRCVPGTSTYAYADDWVGLDGWGSTSKTVEEIGTGSYCQSGGTVSYYAYYDMVPSPPQVFTGDNPGDAIAASVYYDSTHHDYSLVLTDVTNGNQINVTAACPSGSTCKNSSAEAITEATGGGPPAVNLADFGMINRTGATVTSRSGLRGSLGSTNLWSSVDVNMTDPSTGVRMATPSPLYGGQAFNVAWNAAS